jgi:hypothetical protein
MAGTTPGGPRRGIVCRAFAASLDAGSTRTSRRSTMGDKTPKRPPKQKKPKAPKA